MRHINWKKFSFISVGLISSLLLVLGVSYSLATSYRETSNNSQIGLQNQSFIKTQADAVSNASLNDANFGANNESATSLSNQPITLSDGSYVVTTQNGISKISPFGSILYTYSFTNLDASQYGSGTNYSVASFDSYQSRQVIQNYAQPDLFYLLIYSPNLSITTTNFTSITINSPGFLLTLQDTGSGFSLLTAKALLLGNLSQIQNVLFSATLVGPATTDDEINGIKTNAASSSSSSVVKKLNEKLTANSTSTKNAPGFNYNKTLLENLYLNNLNNMAFIDNTTTSGATDWNIFIFGGSNLPNFWFYAFKANEMDNTTPVATVQSTLYVTSGVAMPSNLQTSAPKPKISGYSGTNYPAFFVDGAKTLAINNYQDGQVTGTQYRVEAAFEMPGFIQINNTSSGTSSSSTSDQSMFLNTSFYDFKSTTTTTSNDKHYTKATYYFLTSMNNQTASNIASSPTNRLLFDPNASVMGFHFTTLNFQTSKIDGYANSLTDKLYNFDVEAIPPASGNGQAAVNALLTFRDSISRIIYNPSNSAPTTLMANLANIPSTYSNWGLSGNLVDDQTSRIQLTSQNVLNQATAHQIMFNANTWYLLVNDSTNSATSSRIVGINMQGSAVPPPTNNTSSPTQLSPLVLFDFQSITGPENSEIVGLLPVSDSYVYALIKDLTTNNITINLFSRNSNNAPYQRVDGYTYSANQLPTYQDGSKIWGTITRRDANYLRNAGYFSSTSSQIANNQSLLQNLISFTPAWPGQKATVTAGSTDDQTVLPVTINVEYYNGQMYNNQSFQNSLGFPDYSITDLAGQPSWVIPVAVGVSVGLAAIILVLGLSIGIPMAKNRKLQDKGFAHTYKKVDTLTSAVGSVYKKIITQTAAVKKKPQMLKAGGVKKPAVVKKPSAPSPVKKPAAPVKKPSAPSPVKKPAAPSAPAAPVA